MLFIVYLIFFLILKREVFRKIRATELYDSVLVRPGYVQQENVLQPIPEQYTKNDVFTVPTQQPPFSNNFHFSQMY